MSIRRSLTALSPTTLALVVLWCALTIVALVPVWHQRMLPMLDTPDHLALARAWHDYHHAAYRIADYYTLRVRVVPYFLFYALIHLLLFVCKIEIANKLVLSAYLILFPLSILALARALGRSPWLALGAFALAFNPGWIYGFTSYLLGTCFLFFGLAALIRFVDDGQRRHGIALAVASTLAYLSHVMVWGLLGVCALSLLLFEWRRLPRVALAAAAMIPSLLLALLAFVQERREHAYMTHGNQFAGVWKDVPTSIGEFPRRVMELFPGRLDMWILATLALTTLALLAWPPRPVDSGAARGTRRLGHLLIVLLLVYVSLPFTIKQPMSWWYVAARVPALMAPLMLLWPTAHPRRWQVVAWAPTVIASIVLPLQLTQLYGDFNRRTVGFMRLIDQLPVGSSTLVLARGLISGDAESSGDPSSSAPVYWHFMSWPMALKGGFSPYVFDQGIPVQPRSGTPQYNVAKTDQLDFSSAPEFDYYLVHASSDPVTPDRRVREEATWGAWTLYKRAVPLTDEP